MVPKTPDVRQQIPVRCRLCVSKKQPHGKIFDAVSTKRIDALYFLQQHARGLNHSRLVAKREAEAINAKLEFKTTQVQCKGLSLQDESCGSLAHMAKHVQLWHLWRVLSPEIRKHSYEFQDNVDSFLIRHGDCETTCEPVVGRRDVCAKCLSLVPMVKKAVVRCALKHFGAQVLFSRMFEDPTALEAKVQAMKADFLYERHRSQIDKVLTLQPYELQTWVRASFLSVRKDRRNGSLTSFLVSVVEPTLNINGCTASAKKPAMLQAQAMFERYREKPQVEELDQVSLAIGKACVSGRLQGNPMIMGLILSCLRVLERKDDGKSGVGETVGRVGQQSCLASDKAKDLAREAGRLLAFAGANQQMLGLFGCCVRPWKGCNYLQSLDKASLPKPFLSLLDEDLHRNNLKLIDQRFAAMGNSAKDCHECHSHSICFEGLFTLYVFNLLLFKYLLKSFKIFYYIFIFVVSFAKDN